MRLMSTSRPGVASRSFMSGSRLWPPASTLASPSPEPRWVSASATEVGATYLNAAGIMPPPRREPIGTRSALASTGVADPSPARRSKPNHSTPPVRREHPGWVKGETTNEVVGLKDYVDHIDHVCQVTGSARHVAIGTDLDGGYGTEQCPHDLDTIADLQTVPRLLQVRGHAHAD